MRLKLPLLALGAGLLVPGAGCTAIVVEDRLADQIPCASAGDCAAGFACADGLCALVDGEGAPPPEGTTLGAEGGEVGGPDGVALSLPAGALTGEAAFTIERASATHVALGCAEASGFYRVSPTLELATPATLTVPAPDCDDCVLCAEPEDDGAWLPLDEPAIAPSGSAAGLLTRTGGVVVAGVPQ